MLMEGTPNEINIVILKQGLLSIKYVKGVHDLHVWSISDGKLAMTVHLVIRGKSG
jgi:Co/Zn/Cd efflux system component